MTTAFHLPILLTLLPVAFASCHCLAGLVVYRVCCKPPADWLPSPAEHCKPPFDWLSSLVMPGFPVVSFSPCPAAAVVFSCAFPILTIDIL